MPDGDRNETGTRNETGDGLKARRARRTQRKSAGALERRGEQQLQRRGEETQRRNGISVRLVLKSPSPPSDCQRSIMFPAHTCCLNRFLKVQSGRQTRHSERIQFLIAPNYFVFVCQLTPPVRYNRGRFAADSVVSSFVHA